MISQFNILIVFEKKKCSVFYEGWNVVLGLVGDEKTSDEEDPPARKLLANHFPNVWERHMKLNVNLVVPFISTA